MNAFLWYDQEPSRQQIVIDFGVAAQRYLTSLFNFSDLTPLLPRHTPPLASQLEVEAVERQLKSPEIRGQYKFYESVANVIYFIYWHLTFISDKSAVDGFEFRNDLCRVYIQ